MPEPWKESDIAAICAAHAGREGALLPILHEVQARFGCVPPGAVPIVAQALNLSRAEVHGVVSYYHDFKEKPADGPVVKLCLAEACQARGLDGVRARLKQAGIAYEPIYCLGLCGVGPAALVADKPFAALDGAGFDRLVKAVA